MLVYWIMELRSCLYFTYVQQKQVNVKTHWQKMLRYDLLISQNIQNLDVKAIKIVCYVILQSFIKYNINVKIWQLKQKRSENVLTLENVEYSYPYNNFRLYALGLHSLFLSIVYLPLKCCSRCLFCFLMSASDHPLVFIMLPRQVNPVTSYMFSLLYRHWGRYYCRYLLA